MIVGQIRKTAALPPFTSEFKEREMEMKVEGSLLHTKKRKILIKELRGYTDNWDLYLLLIIPLILILVFCYYPMLGLQIAFKNYNVSGGIWASPWVGMNQFIKMFNTPKFSMVFWNTVRISAYQIILESPITALFALILNVVRSRGYKKTIQMVTYMPHFISTVIMVGILSQILNPRVGFYGQLCNILNIESVDIWSKPAAFPHIYVLSAIWQNLGWNSIIYLAALSSVDTSLYEAASIDGAGRLRQIVHIDVPSILPTFTILFIMRIGSMMTVGYEKVLLMQNTLNLSTSEIISTYSYKVALETGTDYSYGAAVGLFNSIINLVLIIAANTLSKRVTQTSLW